jgi:spore coat-associated protein N
LNKVLIALMTIVVVIGLVGGGALAWFSDTETSSANSFAAGTLNLTVDGKDDPSVPMYFNGSNITDHEGNIKPGDTANVTIDLDNTGSLKGKAYITFGSVTNNGGLNPESEGQLLAVDGRRDGERFLRGQPRDA